MNFDWNWQCVPYLACVVALVALGLITVTIRGDRVLRLGVLGAVATTLPWAFTSVLAASTQDPTLAARLLRLGNGPVALIGPSLLLVLLGVTGQLERHRWLARTAALIGVVMMTLCWSTDWIVAGVHRLHWGMYYISAGPLTPLHLSQLGIWLVVGMVIARRTSTSREKQGTSRLILAILAGGAIGSGDLLLVYDVWGMYPMAWLPTLAGCGVALYLVLRTDLLRPQGVDRGAVIELITFVIATVIVGYIVVMMTGATEIAIALVASGVWVVALAIAWGIAARVNRAVAPDAESTAVAELGNTLAELRDDKIIGDRLATAWARLGITNVTLVRDPLPIEVTDWLVTLKEPLASGDLATMRVGPIRQKLEAMFVDDTTLIVPLVDRGSLLGVIRGSHERALRDVTRGIVLESGRVVARALAFAQLTRAAAEQGEVAREVEVASAMRLQAAASRGDELGAWSVGAEYRSAARTTGASWSSALLEDGRLALLVTEAEAHGVPAALATAALRGAFAATTSTGDSSLDLDQLLAGLRATADGMVRGGEPLAAFVGILDQTSNTIAWASTGHPGAVMVSASAAFADSLGEPNAFPQGSIDGRRPKAVALGGKPGAMAIGSASLPADAVIVIASSELRGDDEVRWRMRLFELAASGSRMPGLLVERALERGTPLEDLLAVVVRVRAA